MVSRGGRQAGQPLPNPLNEVFGLPPDMTDPASIQQRDNKSCPFGNGRSLHCTKSKARNPIGVCSIRRNDIATITCPVRFRQNLLIGNDAARFFFQNVPNPDFRVLTEVRLEDRLGNPVGNIDIIVVRLDAGRIVDYGAVEVQGTYITGNVTNPFIQYMQDQVTNANMTWPAKNAPRADYLSSSRKRLAPQLRYKGYILNSWDRKMAVVVDRPFFDELLRISPFQTSNSPIGAQIAWFVYELQRSAAHTPYTLTRVRTEYTDFASTLDRINTPVPGEEKKFLNKLQHMVDVNQLAGTPEEIELAPDVDAPTTLDDDE